MKSKTAFTIWAPAINFFRFHVKRLVMQFSVKRVQRNGFHLIQLQDTATGFTASIAPEQGGILYALEIPHPQQKDPLNLILSYDSPQDFAEHVGSKGFRGAKMFPFACRLKDAGYTWQGTTYRADKYLLGDHALHGLIYDAAYKASEINDSGLAAVQLEQNFPEGVPGYPFPFCIEIEYRLLRQQELEVITRITNNHTAPIPVHDGWHPYFRTLGSVDLLQLQINAPYQWEFDSGMLPTGNSMPFAEEGIVFPLKGRRFDDCFTVAINGQPAARLIDATHQITIDIIPRQNYGYLQVYTPDDRASIAIENLSGIPDCFNNQTGLLVLEPKETCTLSTSYRVRTAD